MARSIDVAQTNHNNMIKRIIKKNKVLLTIAKKIEKLLLWCLPRSMAHKIFYRRVTDKELNLSFPKDFNEKLHYLIVYKFGKKEAQYADKYLVREYIEKSGYGELLPKLYGTYKKSREINFDKLPDQFVLKTNHGCGGVIICQNKCELNIDACKKQLDNDLKRNYAKVALEYHYGSIKSRIICEEYINDGSGQSPIDYKIYCFNGKPECVLTVTERDIAAKLSHYDRNWNRLEHIVEKYRSEKELDKPVNLEEMMEISADLSKPFPFVRVDFYNVAGKIYFGELSFTPAAGVITYFTQETLDYFGSLIDVDKY